MLIMEYATKFDWIFNQFSKEFEVERKRSVQQFSGMQFTKEGKEVTTQSHLINQIIKDVGWGENQYKYPDIPMRSSQILQRNQHEPNHDESIFYYESMVGKPNYLGKSSRPDIAYAVHQWARFS